MAEDWAAVAAEVADAIAEVGFAATLRKPGGLTGPESNPVRGVPTDYPVTVIDDQVRIRDATGTLTGQTMRVLTIGATGVTPAKDDQVQVRGKWLRVIEVRPFAPGGVDLLFDLEVMA